jgi:hypothetical protein
MVSLDHIAQEKYIHVILHKMPQVGFAQALGLWESPGF